MSGITRRGALSGAMAGAVIGLSGTSWPAFAAHGLTVPRKPMRLMRRIDRGMRDGAVLTVEREWQIEFANHAAGFSITGNQISARVDAPQALRSIARLEEARSTSAMFPILLNATGAIASTGELEQTDEVLEAVREAEAIIARRPIPASAKAQQLQYMLQLQRASASVLDRMPKDLFFPHTQPSRTVQPVKLPDGQEGEFELVYAAQTAKNNAWLGRVERRIVTRIEQSERRSSEVWAMTTI